MPRALARAFTASSNDFGTRILSCSLFFSNSNRTGFRPDRSYSVRSAVATKRSASASLLKVGIFFFIVPDLLGSHVPGADRTDEPFPALFPDRKDKEHAPALLRLAYGFHALLCTGMR